MYDTQVTVVGNVLNTPEWRRLESSQACVARFKVAATSRRYDRDSGRWVDGASLRVRVNCWRRLAENVTASVLSGDPVIVTGRMYTRDWLGDDGQRRVSYELDAIAVGHDLARGQSRFKRQRHSLSTTMLDDDPDGTRRTTADAGGIADNGVTDGGMADGGVTGEAAPAGEREGAVPVADEGSVGDEGPVGEETQAGEAVPAGEGARDEQDAPAEIDRAGGTGPWSYRPDRVPVPA